jgi:hypothetical protein
MLLGKSNDSQRVREDSQKEDSYKASPVHGYFQA